MMQGKEDGRRKRREGGRGRGKGERGGGGKVHLGNTRTHAQGEGGTHGQPNGEKRQTLEKL